MAQKDREYQITKVATKGKTILFARLVWEVLHRSKGVWVFEERRVREKMC